MARPPGLLTPPVMPQPVRNTVSPNQYSPSAGGRGSPIPGLPNADMYSLGAALSQFGTNFGKAHSGNYSGVMDGVADKFGAGIQRNNNNAAMAHYLAANGASPAEIEAAKNSPMVAKALIAKITGKTAGPTTQQKDYQYAVKNDGFKGTFQQWLDRNETANDPKVIKVKQEDGSEVLTTWNKDKTALIPIPAPEGGTAVSSDKKLSERQSQLELFSTLQRETSPVLLEMEKTFNPANMRDNMAGGIIGGNFFRSQQGQMYATAANAWAEGALRIATGAAAQQPEIERTKNTYFAQVGDTEGTIKFKAQMRAMYARAIQAGLGRKTDGTLKTPMEFYEENPQGPTDPEELDAINKEIERRRRAAQGGFL